MSTVLQTEGLTKNFGLRRIILDLSIRLEEGDVVGITGDNGSGKSTLLKLLADVLDRSGGSIRYETGGVDVLPGKLGRICGFVAPYLQLYTEFTAWEHVEMVEEMRGNHFDPVMALQLFEEFGIAARRDDALAEFSSGMLQRVKFICALVHSPSFLFLDEPTTNLDRAGIAAIHKAVARDAARRITVIATNDPEDLTLCTKRLDLMG